jgi:hypothetical protein
MRDKNTSLADQEERLLDLRKFRRYLLTMALLSVVLDAIAYFSLLIKNTGYGTALLTSMIAAVLAPWALWTQLQIAKIENDIGR